jgi:dipeptidyl aminopeptidase/acylaminoacyl peptidase
MAELKEIFEMVTNKTEPDLDAWQEQERRQRRRGAGRRAAAFAVAAVVLVLAIVAGVRLTEADRTGPAGTSISAPPVGITSHFLVHVQTGDRTALPAVIPGGLLVAVSPDGRTLAYNACCSPGDYMAVVNADGTGDRTIAERPLSGYAATWSPDGSTIVFQGRNPTGMSLGGLYAYDISTGDLSEVVAFDGMRNPLWILSSDISPDGRTLLFHLPRGNPAAWDLWTVPITGGTPTLLHRNAGFASYGPDGSIVYLDHPKDLTGGSIWIMNADGSEERMLVSGGPYAWPKVSPDGTQVAYEEGGRAYVLNVGCGRIIDLGPGVEPAWVDNDTVLVG